MTIDISNRWLTELKGKSYNSKTMLDADRYMKEQIKSFYGGHIPSFKESATIVCHDKGEIKGIGASCVDDLILDNFGKLLAGLIRSPVTGASSITMTNESNLVKTINVWNTVAPAFNVVGNNIGTYTKMGSGATAPARTDYKIETNLLTAPESGYQNTGNGGWNSALGKMTTANTIISGGSGTVKESGLVGIYADNASVVTGFLLAHDAITPNVDFVIAQNLTCQYVFTM